MTESLKLSNLHGSETRPIIIDGGGVTIDCEYTAIPLLMTECSWVSLRDFTFCNGQSDVVRIENSHDIRLDMVHAFNADPHANAKVFKVHYCERLIASHCVGWGTGRKIYELTFSNDCLLEYCFGRWEFSTRKDPKMVFAPAYNSLRNRLVCCLGECAALPPLEAGNFQGVYGADNTWAIGTVPSDCVCEDCVAISKHDVRAFVPGATCKILYERCQDFIAH
jgi:hypothetical protein